MLVETEEKMLHGIPLRPRPMLRPIASVSMNTPQEREEMLAIIRQVMDTHHEVLTALKDR